MNERIASLPMTGVYSSRIAKFFHKFFRQAFFGKLKSFTNGYIVIHDEFGISEFGDQQADLKVKININSSKFYHLLGIHGALGAGYAYIENYWTTDNLTNLIRIFARNQKVLTDLESGIVNIQAPIMAFLKYNTRNTLNGSKSNIAKHYDLSNDFFQTFLSKDMMYSSAYWPSPEANLEQASTTKLERICQKLKLNKNDQVLEIGTGWGGFAVYAAEHYGCKITSITISKQQYKYATELVKQKGLQDKVQIILQDYREAQGQYDKIISIEMIEAVGYEFLGNYLKKCADLLKPEGQVLLQAITINDQNFESALSEVDFIKKYIFPGSFIPSLHAILSKAKENTDLRLYHMDDMSDHYARTLEAWQARFEKSTKKIQGMGFDAHFCRMWDYYFSYCIGGFKERSIGSVQLVFGKPQFRGEVTIDNCTATNNK